MTSLSLMQTLQAACWRTLWRFFSVWSLALESFTLLVANVSSRAADPEILEWGQQPPECSRARGVWAISRCWRLASNPWVGGVEFAPLLSFQSPPGMTLSSHRGQWYPGLFRHKIQVRNRKRGIFRREGECVLKDGEGCAGVTALRASVARLYIKDKHGHILVRRKKSSHSPLPPTWGALRIGSYGLKPKSRSGFSPAFFYTLCVGLISTRQDV